MLYGRVVEVPKLKDGKYRIAVVYDGIELTAEYEIDGGCFSAITDIIIWSRKHHYDAMVDRDEIFEAAEAACKADVEQHRER